MKRKPSIPFYYWPLWWLVLLLADVIFYVLLTPIWIGLRTLAWVAEFRARRRQPASERVSSGVSPPGPTR